MSLKLYCSSSLPEDQLCCKEKLRYAKQIPPCSRLRVLCTREGCWAKLIECLPESLCYPFHVFCCISETTRGRTARYKNARQWERLKMRGKKRSGDSSFITGLLCSLCAKITGTHRSVAGEEDTGRGRKEGTKESQRLHFLKRKEKKYR